MCFQPLLFLRPPPLILFSPPVIFLPDPFSLCNTNFFLSLFPKSWCPPLPRALKTLLRGPNTFLGGTSPFDPPQKFWPPHKFLPRLFQPPRLFVYSPPRASSPLGAQDTKTRWGFKKKRPPPFEKNFPPSASAQTLGLPPLGPR